MYAAIVSRNKQASRRRAESHTIQDGHLGFEVETFHLILMDHLVNLLVITAGFGPPCPEYKISFWQDTSTTAIDGPWTWWLQSEAILDHHTRSLSSKARICSEQSKGLYSVWLSLDHNHAM
jgi:hypothetical protein